MLAGLDENDLTVMRFEDYHLNFPEDGLYCRAETLARDPDLCRQFVQASLEGWRYAFAHEDEALDVVMRQVNQANRSTNRVHQRWMLNHMKPVILPDSGGAMGVLTREEYTNVAETLRQGGVIQHIPEWTAFYDDCASPR